MGLRWMILLAVCAAGAVCDLKNGKIPNRILITGWIAEGIAVWIGDMDPLKIAGLLHFLFLTAGGLIMFCPLFFLRICGAGDVKLAALIVGSCGIAVGVRILAAGLIPAGLWSLAVMMRQGLLARRMRCLYDYLKMTAALGEVTAYPGGGDKSGEIRLAPFILVGVLTVFFRWIF